MSSRLSSGIAIAFVLTISLVSFSPAVSASTEWYDWPERGRISIGSDNAFTAGNGVSGGSGTHDDPYIIENWRIWNETGVNCISITNTQAYFIVRNVYVKTSSTGIYLHNVVHGSIVDCIATDSSIGISLAYCKKCSIVNCTLSRDIYGITLTECKDITVKDNGFHDNLMDKQVNKEKHPWIEGSLGSTVCASILIVLIAVLCLIAWGRLTYKPPRKEGPKSGT